MWSLKAIADPSAFSTPSHAPQTVEITTPPLVSHASEPPRHRPQPGTRAVVVATTNTAAATPRGLAGVRHRQEGALAARHAPT